MIQNHFEVHCILGPFNFVAHCFYFVSVETSLLVVNRIASFFCRYVLSMHLCISVFLQLSGRFENGSIVSEQLASVGMSWIQTLIFPLLQLPCHLFGDPSRYMDAFNSFSIQIGHSTQAPTSLTNLRNALKTSDSRVGHDVCI